MFVIHLLFALLPRGISAQASEPKSPVDRPIEAPVTMNGQKPSLAFQSEETRINVLTGGMALTGTFNDNAFFTSTDHLKDFSYLVQPYLSFAQSMPRVNWDVNVGSALIVHQQVSEDNQAAVTVHAALGYRLSPHANLRVGSEYDNTTALYSTLNPVQSASDIGIVEQANTSLLVPFSQRTLTISNLIELNDQVSPRSIVGARGVYTRQDFPRSSQNSQFGPLYNSQTYLGEAFYNYQLSAKEWVGVTLRRQRFDTQSLPSGTRTDSFLLFYALNLSPNLTLAFFAGPERFNAGRISDVSTTAGLVRNEQWTAAEGATFTWRGVKTSVLAEFSRQISDGGGLSSAAITQIVYAQVRRQFDSRRELSAGISYAKNDPLLVEAGESLRGLSARLEFQQRLTKNVSGQIGYGRERQDRLSGTGAESANLFWVSISYNFLRPLGK
jgi:hypothetical protein